MLYQMVKFIIEALNFAINYNDVKLDDTSFQLYIIESRPQWEKS